MCNYRFSLLFFCSLVEGGEEEEKEGGGYACWNPLCLANSLYLNRCRFEQGLPCPGDITTTAIWSIFTCIHIWSQNAPVWLGYLPLVDFLLFISAFLWIFLLLLTGFSLREKLEQRVDTGILAWRHSRWKALVCQHLGRLNGNHGKLVRFVCCLWCTIQDMKRYCAVTALGRHYEIAERRCRQSSEGGSWGEVLEKQNRIKTAAENGREDHRAEIELWDSEERQSPDKLNREAQSGFDFCSKHTHARPSSLSFLRLCLSCFFDHTPSSSLFSGWDTL